MNRERMLLCNRWYMHHRRPYGIDGPWQRVKYRELPSVRIKQHRWAQSWPGNYCRDCGFDDPWESAIVCRKCYMPCSPEEEAKDPIPRFCSEHAALIAEPCAIEE